MIKTVKKAKVIAGVGGRIDSIPCRASYFPPGWYEKRMSRITPTWWNGCFGIMDDHPVHTIPSHRPTKLDVLPNTSVQITLASKWLVQHSSIHPSSIPPSTIIWRIYGWPAAGGRWVSCGSLICSGCGFLCGWCGGWTLPTTRGGFLSAGCRCFLQFFNDELQ